MSDNDTNAPGRGAALADQLGLLPIGPHDHPEPQTMAWSELELQAIRQYAARCVATERERCARKSLTREQIDAVMTEHYPLSSLLREEVDAFERCVRDIERLHSIGA